MNADKKFENRIFQKSDNIVSRKIADEMVLVPIRGNLADMQRIFSLTPVAEFIWNHLDGTKSLRDIHKAVIQSYETDDTTAKKDITELVNQLIDYELIRDVS